jgi:adenine-specific DNA-methyltransferase
MDEIFGSENFLNEIVWRRKGGSALAGMSRLSISTDTILLYTKTKEFTFNEVRMQPDQEYIDEMFKKTDENGRRYMITVISSPTYRPNLIFDYKGYQTPPKGWRYSLDKMKKLDEEGLLYFPEDKSKQIYKKIYLDDYDGQVITTLWSDISLLKGKNAEITDYPTQKPEELLRTNITIILQPRRSCL